VSGLAWVALGTLAGAAWAARRSPRWIKRFAQASVLVAPSGVGEELTSRLRRGRAAFQRSLAEAREDLKAELDACRRGQREAEPPA
jgi:hypothetical protein